MMREIIDVEMSKFFGENKFIDLSRWILNWDEFKEEEGDPL
jgi:hypothetical protein